MCPKAVLWVTALQLPAVWTQLLTQVILLAIFLQTHRWPHPLDDEHASALWKGPWPTYAITLLLGTPKVRASDISHCKPRGDSSLSPGAFTAEQAPCPSHRPVPHSPGTLTHHPLTQFNIQGCILWLYTYATYQTEAATRVPGQIAFSSSPAFACPCLQQPQTAWMLLRIGSATATCGQDTMPDNPSFLLPFLHYVTQHSENH